MPNPQGPSRWMQCTAPGCSTKKNGIRAMDAHINEAHGGKTNRMVAGATEIMPGVAELEDEPDEVGIVGFLESMADDARTKVTPGREESTGKIDRALVEAMDTYMFKGKRYPEKVLLWKKDGTPKLVPVKDTTTAILRWGLLRKQPPEAVWSKKFKHILCPVESCPAFEGNQAPCPKGHVKADGTPAIGDCMSTPGNEEYALIHHLERGNREHKFYFAQFEDELKEKFRAAFKMVATQNRVEKSYSTKARKELTAV